MADATPSSVKRGPFAPLRVPVFRRIWSASLFANFGALILGVGAAWAMTTMTGRADLVAAVQSVTWLPVMLGSIFSGAVADTYDRRKVTILAQCLCFSGALGLALITFFGLLSPGLLLVFCFVVGCGTALFTPSWAASVSEQVPRDDLPAAVGLNSISYNIARSFGPAIGGLLVAIGGVIAAFIFSTVAYVPLILTMYFWRRRSEKSRLPPEGLTRAMISGIRYVFHSPQIRIAWIRTFLFGLCGSATSALMPLIVRDLLGGGPSSYGILLGVFGMGAVSGALYMGRLRRVMSVQRVTTILAITMGCAVSLLSWSQSAFVASPLLFIAGVGWMIVVAQFNILTQVVSPRWVGGRALAAFQVSITGGIVIGGWGWGHFAAEWGVRAALLASGIALIANIVPSLLFKVDDPEQEDRELGEPLPDVEVKLNLIGRSGPIVLTIEYRVPVERARDFYRHMQKVQLVRQRSGAYGWSIAREISDPELWTERYHTPTWHDYLRQRNRLSPADREITNQAHDFHIGSERPKLRRKLERPFGSVRWADDTPDAGGEVVVPLRS